MSTRCHLFYFRFCLCLLVVAMLSGCASRTIVTAVEDQSYVPGLAPQAQALVNDVLTDSFGKLVQDTKIESKSLRLTSP